MSESGSADVSPALAALQAAEHHHVSMTATADLKASILLATSLATVALTLAAAHRPAVVGLFATGLGTAFFCILAMMPRTLILRGADSKTEVNLLFCGHFSGMQEEDYVSKVKGLLATPEATVEALSRDLFQMGLLVHQKKFRFLGHAYTVCLLGLMLTALLAFLGRTGLI
jgi:hypothetical protein